MLILPSLLEYSLSSLETKITLLQNQKQAVNLIQFQGSSQKKFDLGLHLDFVMKGFAQNIGVMMSLSEKTVMENLQKKFGKQKLYLSIHLMGDIEDMIVSYKFWSSYKPNSNWIYKLFVPYKFAIAWQEISFCKLGVWLDLAEWAENNLPKDLLKTEEILLMTVKAGKAGQKLSNTTMSKGLETVKNNPNINFTLDGGQSLDTGLSDYKNLEIVSYSSFWNKFNSSV